MQGLNSDEEKKFYNNGAWSSEALQSSYFSTGLVSSFDPELELFVFGFSSFSSDFRLQILL
jgi:hypothetical protein